MGRNSRSRGMSMRKGRGAQESAAVVPRITATEASQNGLKGKAAIPWLTFLLEHYPS